MKIITKSTNEIQLHPDAIKLFEKYENLFKAHSRLWVQGGIARETLIGIAKKENGYNIDL